MATKQSAAKSTSFSLSSLFKGIGEYPPEYNAKIHGPYNPSVYYGKPDTPLADVKLGQLPAWLSRRNYNPRAMLQCYMRGHWRWAMKYLLPVRPGITPIVQVCVIGSIICYFVQYKAHTNERHAKYH